MPERQRLAQVHLFLALGQCRLALSCCRWQLVFRVLSPVTSTMGMAFWGLVPLLIELAPHRHWGNPYTEHPGLLHGQTAQRH